MSWIFHEKAKVIARMSARKIDYRARKWFRDEISYFKFDVILADSTSLPCDLGSHQNLPLHINCGLAYFNSVSLLIYSS